MTSTAATTLRNTAQLACERLSHVLCSSGRPPITTARARSIRDDQTWYRFCQCDIHRRALWMLLQLEVLAQYAAGRLWRCSDCIGMQSRSKRSRDFTGHSGNQRVRFDSDILLQLTLENRSYFRLTLLVSRPGLGKPLSCSPLQPLCELRAVARLAIQCVVASYHGCMSWLQIMATHRSRRSWPHVVPT